MDKIQDVCRVGRILISKIWWWMLNVFKWRCIVLNFDNNGCGGFCCSNPSGECGNLGGGRVTRGGGDGLEGPGGGETCVGVGDSLGDDDEV
nr:hypothetical protein [Tanacetum cinerariifolium]